MARPIVFLSDFGLQDEFVGVCHGVIAAVAPEVRVIDLTHAVPPRDVLGGAVLLAETACYMPDDAVFLAVVDPGVGTARRPVAARAASGHLLVGPDNGLLVPACRALGGVTAAREVAARAVLLEPRSATFHGRDVFAPAAAHLAAGMRLEEVGPAISPESLVQPRIAEVEVRLGGLSCQVLGIDRFGNVQLAARPEDLERAGLGGLPQVQVRIGHASTAVPRARSYGDVGEGFTALIVDSRDHLALVRNGASAAAALGVAAGDRVVVEAPPGLG